MTNTIQKAQNLKADLLRVAVKNKQGHIAPSLSCLDILTVLHYGIADPKDTIILSKGHGCYGLYAIWADLGLLDRDKWENFDLPGCLEGYGSLGHGLPVAVGVAYANKLLKNDKHTWVIVGDGELQEGSNWEALSFMFHYNLTNISIIVDCNKLQAMDSINNILFQNLTDRFRGWGFHALQCGGHNHIALKRRLGAKSLVVLAHTVKGRGIKEMENKAEWHFKVPNDKQK